MRTVRMKSHWLLLGLVGFAGAIGAEETDSCAGLDGSSLTQCRSNLQTRLQQERLEQQLQLQQERQNQLDQQQREVQQQLDSLRLQNDSLRKQLERDAAQPVRQAATASTSPTSNSDVMSWKADNAWFGADYARTQFAMHYVKQLQKERPDLAGRPLLDALSTKVNETFGATK